MAQRLVRLAFAAIPISLSLAVWSLSGSRLAAAGEQERPPVAKTDRVDIQGDPLPEDALVRIGSVRLRHAHNAKDVAFSPDGKILASVAYDHTVRLWDPATGKELRQFAATEAERASIHSPARYLSRVVFSPDGQRVLASELHNGIRVWDSVTGKFLTHIQGANGVTGMAFSPDGTMLATSGRDGTVRFWDGAALKLRQQINGHKGAVNAVAWGPNGKMLASGGDDQTIRVWDASSGRELIQFGGHQAQVTSVTFSADGKYVVSGSVDQTVRLWDPETGKERVILGRHEGPVLSVACAADGKTVASASADGAIKLWDVASGKMVHLLAGHFFEVRGLSFSPDSKTIASASDDQKIGIWDTKTGKELFPQPGHQEAPFALRFLDDDRTLVSLSRDDTIRWWDWRQAKQERSIAWKHNFPPRATAFSPDGKILAVALPQDGVRLLETKTGTDIGRLDEGKGAIVALAFSPDGQIVGVTDGKKVSLWNTATREIAKRIPGEFADIQFLLYSPGGKLLLGGAKTSYLWDPVREKSSELSLSFARFKSATFTPDSRILACGDRDGKVELWDVESGEKVRVLIGVGGYVNLQSTSISPDNRLLAAAGWNSIKIWEIETGLERRGFHGFYGDGYAVAFSPDGRALASGLGGQQMLVWDVPGKALNVDPKIAGAKVVPGLFKDLAAADGGLVHRAIWELVGRPAEAVPYLKTVLKPAASVNGPRLAQLIKDLDSEVFAERENASKELPNLGEAAEPAIKRLLDDSPSLEVKLRAKSVLDQLTSPLASPERLQRLRAIEVLENIGTSEARALLQEIARGAAEARFTREATAALNRLAKRPASQS